MTPTEEKTTVLPHKYLRLQGIVQGSDLVQSAKTMWLSLSSHAAGKPLGEVQAHEVH